VIADTTLELSPHWFERTVVLLLALLAVDSLVERIGLLERMYELLQQRAVGLSDRSTLNADEIFADAQDVTLSGITLLNILTERQHLFQALLTRGTRFRVLLLDPKSSACAAWNETVVDEPIQAHLETALAVLRRMRKIAPLAPLEVRFAPQLLPTCLVIVDPALPRGRLVGEIIFSDIPPFRRPHLRFTRAEDPEWFAFFCERFESVWQKSNVVEP